MSNKTIDKPATEKLVVHYGPVWSKPISESLALCSAPGEHTLSTNPSWVNCEDCGKIMRAMRDGEYGT